MIGESTEHFTARDSIIRKCVCSMVNGAKKCKFQPCPACKKLTHGPCIHCWTGERRFHCKYWKENTSTIPKLQSDILSKERWAQ